MLPVDTNYLLFRAFNSQEEASMFFFLKILAEKVEP